MPVHYAFKTNEGVTHRRLQIPESPDENLRGENYDQEDIDWLHEGEKENTVRDFRRQQARRTEDQEPLVLEEMWTERQDGTVVQKFKIVEDN